VGNTGAREEEQAAHLNWGMWQIEQYLKDPKQFQMTAPAEPPDGPPIGMEDKD
jgi:hypothetical protein